MDDGTRTGFGYEVIQARNGGAAAGNHVLGVTGIRFQSIRSALLAAAQACGECEEWRVVERLPRAGASGPPSLAELRARGVRMGQMSTEWDDTRLAALVGGDFVDSKLRAYATCEGHRWPSRDDT